MKKWGIHVLVVLLGVMIGLFVRTMFFDSDIVNVLVIGGIIVGVISWCTRLPDHRLAQFTALLLEEERPAILLTQSATTSLWEYIHGELWLLPDGLLRVRRGLLDTLKHGLGPSVSLDTVETQDFTDKTFNALIADKKNLWIPQEQIVAVILRHGIIADELNLQLTSGATIRLFWSPADHALFPLRFALSKWLEQDILIQQAVYVR